MTVQQGVGASKRHSNFRHKSSGEEIGRKKIGTGPSEGGNRYLDDLGTIIRKVPLPGAKKRGLRQPAYVVSTTGAFRLVSMTRTSHAAAGHAVVYTQQDLEQIRNPGTAAGAVAAEAKAAAEAKLATLVAHREEEQLAEIARQRAELEISVRGRSEEASAARARVAALLEEQKDEVKRMNQMVLYSKCVAIRDAQVKDKASRKVAEATRQRNLDAGMEADRLAALCQYEEREAKRVAEMRRGLRVLEAQCEERHEQALHRQDLATQERTQMNAEIERLRELDLSKSSAKRAAADMLMKEVSASNAQLMARKREARAVEIEEDKRIARYVRDRDARDQAVAEERERAAAEKELETSRLRARQEKANDRRSELDELRARRWQEAYEREWRGKELAEIGRKAAINRDLVNAREAQQSIRLARQADAATSELRQFQRVLLEARREEAITRKLDEEKVSVAQRYKAELQQQMGAHEDAQRAEKAAHVAEAHSIKAALEAERAAVEAVRARKLQELEAAVVPPRCRAELAKKKLVNW